MVSGGGGVEDEYLGNNLVDSVLIRSKGGQIKQTYLFY